MKKYDQNISYGVHTIKVSFQSFEFKGHVIYEVSGNCKGIDLLSVDSNDLYGTTFKENPINLKDIGDSWYSMGLTSEDGDLCMIEDEWDCIGENIVGVEIIDFVKE